MAQDTYDVGDLVALTKDSWRGEKAIVSVPVTPGRTGHVLLLRDGCILGIDVGHHNLAPLDRTSEGFVQLARKLIDLGSHVIEKKLIDLI
jgi:hypothetical protein